MARAHTRGHGSIDNNVDAGTTHGSLRENGSAST